MTGIFVMGAYGEKLPKRNVIRTEMSALRGILKSLKGWLKTISISFARILDSAGQLCGIFKNQIT